MKNRVLRGQILNQIIALSPLFQRIVESQGLKFLGVFGNHNIAKLPREYLITATVVEDGSIFDRCLRESPIPFKINCFALAVQKAKSMGFRILALRLPTKWERFKLWGWKKLPTIEEIKKNRNDRSPVPVTMRSPIRLPRPMGVMPYGQRLPR